MIRRKLSWQQWQWLLRLPGVVAGAKAVAMTALDLMTTPQLLADAQDFFNNGYVFVRPTELRAAEWSEFMLDCEQGGHIPHWT